MLLVNEIIKFASLKVLGIKCQNLKLKLQGFKVQTLETYLNNLHIPPSPFPTVQIQPPKPVDPSSNPYLPVFPLLFHGLTTKSIKRFSTQISTVTGCS